MVPLRGSETPPLFAVHGKERRFLSLHRPDGREVVRRGLVDEVVEPVLVQQVCVAAPCDHGRLGIVVIRVIVLRHMDGKSGVFIAQIFRLQRPRVVFRMAGDEDLPAALGRHGVDPGLLGRGEDFQLAAALDILAADARVPRVGQGPPSAPRSAGNGGR